MRTKPRVLVVEDDDPKRLAVERLLRSEFPDIDLTCAKSLTSAISELSSARVDLAVIDMSLPTYDFSRDMAGGGRPQDFGGEDIVRFIEAESPTTKSVVLTQYEEFASNATGSRRSLAQLTDSMRRAFSETFLGVIHYSGQHGLWRAELVSLVRSHLEQRE